MANATASAAGLHTPESFKLNCVYSGMSLDEFAPNILSVQ